MGILEVAIKKKWKNLNEYESKQLLAEYGIPITREFLVKSQKEAVAKAEELGFPIVLKAVGRELLHKTEMDLIRLGLRTPKEVREAFKELKEKAKDKLDGILVQEMVKGTRELVMGLIRDPQFGPCTMFGLGGIYTEILRDVSFRVAPITKEDAFEMMEEIRGKKILDAIRGMQSADKEVIANSLINLGRIGLEHPEVKEIDINPLILAKDGKPVAVDALVVLDIRGN